MYSNSLDGALRTAHCPLSTRPLSLAVSCPSLRLCLPPLIRRRHQGARALHAADGGEHGGHRSPRYDGNFLLLIADQSAFPEEFSVRFSCGIPFFVSFAPENDTRILLMRLTAHAFPTLFSTSLPRCLMQASSRTSRRSALSWSSTLHFARRSTARTPSRCCRPCRGPRRSRSCGSLAPTPKVRWELSSSDCGPVRFSCGIFHSLE